MIAAAGSFALLEQLPVNFRYWEFALILLMNGLAMGAFAAPNRAGVMNSLPPQHRGAGSGMNTTFQNSAQVLSIGIFFTLMIVGLSAHLPSALFHGLAAHGVPAAAASAAAHLPPVATLFAAFLGYSPVQHLVGSHVLAALPAHQGAVLTGRSFFPSLIAAPFADGLHTAFDFAIVACLVAAGMSWLRGGKYHYREGPGVPPAAAGALPPESPAIPLAAGEAPAGGQRPAAVTRSARSLGRSSARAAAASRGSPAARPPDQRP
jgi:hypothetical protein